MYRHAHRIQGEDSTARDGTFYADSIRDTHEIIEQNPHLFLTGDTLNTL